MAADFVTVIATSGRPALLGQTLDSLSQCRLPASFRETIVIENGEPCGAEELVRNCSTRLQARYLHQKQAGKSLALNCVLADLDDCFIFFADDDVRFAPDTLQRYDDARRAYTSGVFFGGPTGVDYEQPPPEWLTAFLPNSARGFSLGTESCFVDAPVFLGFNWGAHSRDLKTFGGFDTRKGPGSATGSVGQETDMQHRLLQHGLRGLYLPQAMVWHWVPAARCSVEWACQRSYRTGVCVGLTGFVTYQGLFSRYPLLRMIAQAVLLLPQRRHFFPRTTFILRRLMKWTAGYVRGCRERSRAASELGLPDGRLETADERQQRAA